MSLLVYFDDKVIP